MDMGLVRGLITAAIFVLFVGIAIWSYSRNRHRDFEAASQLPLGDDQAPPVKSDMTPPAGRSVTMDNQEQQS